MWLLDSFGDDEKSISHRLFGAESVCMDVLVAVFCVD